MAANVPPCGQWSMLASSSVTAAAGTFITASVGGTFVLPSNSEADVGVCLTYTDNKDHTMIQPLTDLTFVNGGATNGTQIYQVGQPPAGTTAPFTASIHASGTVASPAGSADPLGGTVPASFGVGICVFFDPSRCGNGPFPVGQFGGSFGAATGWVSVSQ
jgi:hypothetical protein